MYHLIPIPIIFLAFIVWLVSDYLKLKLFKKISKIIIIVAVLVFIYTYLIYRGINLLDYVKMFFGF